MKVTIEIDLDDLLEEVEDALTIEKSINGIIEIKCPYCKKEISLSKLGGKTREEEIEE